MPSRSKSRSRRGTPCCVPRKVSTSTFSAIRAKTGSALRVDERSCFDHLGPVVLEDAAQRGLHVNLRPPAKVCSRRGNLRHPVLHVLVALAVEGTRRGVDD